MTKDVVVYVAGPIQGSGDPFENIGNAMEVGAVLLSHNLYPVIPHLDFTMVVAYGDFLTRKRLLDWDRALILRCDALLRLPGDSPGADYEIEVAEEANIPVYHSVNELVADVKSGLVGST